MKVYTLPNGATLHQGVAFTSEDVSYPENWLELAAAEDLAAHHITVQDVADPTPSPAPPVRLHKSVLVDRLYAAGKLDAARAALDASDLYTREHWNTCDVVTADNPSVLALIKAIGADPAVILAVE